MLTLKKLLTAEEFAQLPGHEDAELIDGHVIPARLSSPALGMITLELGMRIGNWLEQNKLGIAGVEGGFILRRNPDRTRGPDAWFIRTERVPEVQPEGFWEIAPDMIAEIISSSDTLDAIKEKLEDYFAAGTQLAWLIYPRFKQVEAHTPDGTMRIFRVDDVLEAKNLMPGFQCAVNELFEEQP
jgi:Uma2 family endonuclease